MIRKIKLFDFKFFLKADVKITDEISDSIKIGHDSIHFSTENSYVMK